MINTLRYLVICCCSLLVACSHLVKKAEHETTGTNANSEESADKYRDFNQSDDTLYDLMVAEIAAQRQQFNITLVNYIHQARATKDLGIVKRAINAAQFMKDVEAIQEMGLLWAEIEPDSIPANQLLAFQYSLQHQFPQAIKYIDKVIELGGEARVDNLALGSQSLPKEKKLELLALYKELYQKHPSHHEIGHSIALMHRDMKQFDEALALLNPILENEPDFEPSIVLKTSILIEQGDLEVAGDYAGEQYERHPRNHALGRMYASILIDLKELNDAEEVFSDLLKLYPKAPGLKLSHALVMLENEKVEQAKIALETLLEEDIHPNESHFYLGRIADRMDDSEVAIEHYYQVKDGIHFEPALERASYLMTQVDKTDEALEYLDELRSKDPEKAQALWLLQYKLLSTIDDKELALETLNQAIEAFPDDENFRYARAMTFEQNNELDNMEADLRVIIEKNPKHAVAINALGYTLADKTDRTQEALALITLALSLKPENPAILDSMGWVLYRLDQKEEALVFLARAYKNYPDPEVAAHLGEVLYAIGQADEAKKIWEPAFYNNPEHKVLKSTLERLAPEWLKELQDQTASEASSEQPSEETPIDDSSPSE